MSVRRALPGAALLCLSMALTGCSGEAEPTGTATPSTVEPSATSDPGWSEAAQSVDDDQALTAEGGPSDALPYTGHVIRVLPIGAGLIQPDDVPHVPVLLDRPVVRNPALLAPGQPVRFAFELNKRGLPSASDVLVLDGPPAATGAARRAARRAGADPGEQWRSGLGFTGEIVRYDAERGGWIRMDDGLPLEAWVRPGLVPGSASDLVGRRVEFGFSVDENERMVAYEVRLLP